MLKAVILDIDGVLVDSSEANIALYKHILKRAGYTEPRDEAILACFHLPLRQTIAKLTGASQEDVERVYKMVQKERPDVSQLLKFPERLVDTLAELHKRYKLAVVTSRIRIGVDEVFAKAEIGHLFDAAVAFEDYENPKPHPEPLLLALQQLHVDAAEAVYIGDSDTDIEAARQVPMRSIHLSRKPHPDATAVITEFHELIDTINEL